VSGAALLFCGVVMMQNTTKHEQNDSQAYGLVGSIVWPISILSASWCSSCQAARRASIGFRPSLHSSQAAKLIILDQTSQTIQTAPMQFDAPSPTRGVDAVRRMAGPLPI
jgi:hypothetical protein